jgi:hypothetical protein
MAKKNFIAGAIKRPGALTAKAKAAGKTIPELCASPGITTQTKKQCAFAKLLGKLRPK